MGKGWFLILGEEDKQIISDIRKAHPEIKELPQVEVETAYKEFLKSLGVTSEK